MPETAPSSRIADDPLAAQPLRSDPAGPVVGAACVPGDKSISHRAVLLGALAVGETHVTGLLEGEDVLRTVAAMRALGAAPVRTGAGAWRIGGVGLGGLAEPADVLDMGNSGTAARLLLGVLASHDLTAFMTGDRSLRRRPMARVTTPLAQIGARFVARRGARLPLAVIGAADPMPITYALPVASAQVKSAVLLAGLNAPGVTTVIERQPTRDHTERMLRHFGATVDESVAPDGARRIAVTGQPELRPAAIAVPGDVSSAAFPLVAALLCPGSAVTLRNVGLNPGRAGLIDALRAMGADIELGDLREEGGEPVADIQARAGALRGVEVPADQAPSMIDEYPILAVAAACATGRTVMRGLSELRVKESDRLAAIAAGLAACGIAVEAGEDWLAVDGAGGPPPGGGTVATHDDHRIAMSFLVLGMAARAPVAVDDARSIATSFPGFVELMNRLGAAIGPAA